MSDNLIKKYGKNNLYDWSNENWGTKWGDCSLEVDTKQGTMRFESAWSPISNKIMDMFIQDFPNIHYHFMEEIIIKIITVINQHIKSWKSF